MKAVIAVEYHTQGENWIETELIRLSPIEAIERAYRRARELGIQLVNDNHALDFFLSEFNANPVFI